MYSNLVLFSNLATVKSLLSRIENLFIPRIHAMEALSALLTLCEGNPSFKGPVIHSFDMSFVVSLNSC